MDTLLFGTAYYDEYMPEERLKVDIAMIKAAGMNVVRIAESTWSTEEPLEGVFDFSHITRVLEACQKEGLSVIIGTPTYAIPAWMAKKHPEIMVMDTTGHRKPYGARQIMDIMNPDFRFYAERIIRHLMQAVQPYSCVIGFQLDNETKHYGTCGENIQALFVEHLQKTYQGDLQKLNADFGLNYWSNAIHRWQDFPNVNGTINGSLACAFAKFQRSLVTDFLAWQRSLVDEYRRSDQFVTHNFDFEWRGYSFGVQPDVDHFASSKCLSKVACDIYHPTQDLLTGKEIAFCGDMARSLKNDNYYVMETQAQGFPDWTPYEGQIRLHAYSHFASGADSVLYWHWHSIHNSFETYWKGVLSHNLQENAVYREVKILGGELKRLGGKLLHLKKHNSVALLVSNQSLTAIQKFPFAPFAQGKGNQDTYNDIVRWIYDVLFELNIECDIINADDLPADPCAGKTLEQYQAVFVPALYCAAEQTLTILRSYVQHGGALFATFKTAFTNQDVKVYHDNQPYALTDVFGLSYDQFTLPRDVYLADTLFALPQEQRKVETFMELICPSTAQVLVSYDHANWARYAAITQNNYGKGTAVYLGCKTSSAYLKKLLYTVSYDLKLCDKTLLDCPVTVRKGVNMAGNHIRYYLNYSSCEKAVEMPEGTDLITGEHSPGTTKKIKAWDVVILESQANFGDLYAKQQD